ncbi:glycosyltransferase [Nesterenkonia pannonica]|uniref:glycosyltransferase n=1 Tax=Nesterenkonia pannonica TaxID=1548602 RepID=UPI0021640223|nr:glycosyltransferase [Nesterenkonia pannonica]
MTPSISVVIAAYNAQETLAAELDALGRQTFDGEWEVLVCDNGSTDGTAALAASYAGTLPRLRVIDASAVQGPGAARNAGARAAESPCSRSATPTTWSQTTGWPSCTQPSPGRPSSPGVPAASSSMRVRARSATSAGASTGCRSSPSARRKRGNMGVHRQAFLDAGGFDESMRTGEDLDLCWRLQLAGHTLVEKPAAVVTVSNREGLRASIAQTYAYGVGDARLKHKYAQVEAAFRAAPQPPAPTPAAEDEPLTRSRAAAALAAAPKLLRKVIALRRPSDLTDVARRISAQAGYRFGRIDRSAPQVPAGDPARHRRAVIHGEPGISVIMPAFNAASTIEVQLDALAAQRDAPEWELIVADNGSTDGTAETARGWDSRIHGLRVIDASARRGPGPHGISASSRRAAGYCSSATPTMRRSPTGSQAWRRPWAQLTPPWRAGATRSSTPAPSARPTGPHLCSPSLPGGPGGGALPQPRRAPLRLRRRRRFEERLRAAEDIDLCWRLQLAGFSFSAAPRAVMQIRRRTGLRAGFKQAWTYGRGDRVLERRFGPIAQRRRAASDQPPAPPDPPAEGSSEVSARRLRLPDLEFHAHRIGHRMGRALGRDEVPPSMPRRSGERRPSARAVGDHRGLQRRGDSGCAAARSAPGAFSAPLRDPGLRQRLDGRDRAARARHGLGCGEHPADRCVGATRSGCGEEHRRGGCAGRGAAVLRRRRCDRPRLGRDDGRRCRGGGPGGRAAGGPGAESREAHVRLVGGELGDHRGVLAPVSRRRHVEPGGAGERLPGGGGFDEHLGTGEDVDLCWRIQRAGFSFARAPQAVVHSRQREGLRAVFRQAYSYAAGHRALRIKYARLIDAQPSPAAPPTGAEDDAPALPVERLIQRLRRAALSRAGQANLAWRVGELLGSRFGRVHPDVGPLAPH